MPAAIVKIHNPVVARHPITGQFVTLAKGMEVTDPEILREFAWAFQEPDGPQYVDSVRIADVEAATRAPGEKRSTRRGASAA